MTLSRRHIGVNVFEDKIYLRIRPVAEVYKQNRRTAVDVQVALEKQKNPHAARFGSSGSDHEIYELYEIHEVPQ